MALTAWNRELGTTQGRVRPRGVAPVEGDFVFVLGRDLPGLHHRFEVGDFVEVAQTASFGDAKLVRVRARLRPPVTMPAGVAWKASLEIDGVEQVGVQQLLGRTRDRLDLAANVSKLTGDHALAFRLALVGAVAPVEVELPAVYLDAILLDASAARPCVINRDPEPSETQVPITTLIAFDLVDVGPDGIDVAALQVFVAGALAVVGGVFQPGFDGPASRVEVLEVDTVRVVIDPTAPFTSLKEVTVRVVTRTVGGASSLDTAWTFRCEDLTAPRVVGAQARELRRVRVSFDEPVQQQDPEALDDALNPSRYHFARRSAPAVDAVALAVEPVTDSAVDVITDVALSPGSSYRLTVTGVVDRFGNAVAAPFHAADFVAFVPPRPARRRFDLYQLLPALNRREDETGDLRRFLLCLQEVTDLLLHDVDRFSDLLDPDVAPEPVLDRMLLDLGNPFQFDLSVVDKRRLLNVLVAIYRAKGTRVGITNAIRFFLGLEVQIVELTGDREALVLGESLLGESWVLGPSSSFALYAFEIVVPRPLIPEERRRIRAIADYMKPAHTHLLRIVEPTIPEVIDHLELGLSELGETWLLH